MLIGDIVVLEFDVVIFSKYVQIGLEDFPCFVFPVFQNAL